MTAVEDLNDTEPQVDGIGVGIIHLRVADADRALAFFAALFGWESEPFRDDRHTAHYVINTRLLTVITDDPDAPPVRLFFPVDDIRQGMARVESLGGTVVESDPDDGGGWAHVEDDQGMPLGIWHPGDPHRGALPTTTATAEIGYLVVAVGDSERGAAFYGGLLGWHPNPPTPWGYRHVTNANIPLGINPDEQAPRVDLFFRVDDIHEAIEAVRRLGGTVDDEIEDSPSGLSVGFVDDQGTALGLWQPAPQY